MENIQGNKKTITLKKILLFIFTLFLLWLVLAIYTIGQKTTKTSEQIEITGEMYDENSDQ